MRYNSFLAGTPCPDGFEPHSDAFEDAYEMIDVHADLWEASRSRTPIEGDSQ